jgi:hypothetical protein
MHKSDLFPLVMLALQHTFHNRKTNQSLQTDTTKIPHLNYLQIITATLSRPQKQCAATLQYGVPSVHHQLESESYNRAVLSRKDGVVLDWPKQARHVAENSAETVRPVVEPRQLSFAGGKDAYEVRK